MSLRDLLEKNQWEPFPEWQIMLFAKSIAEAVEQMHDMMLVHTDLKPENILLMNDELIELESGFCLPV